MSRVQQQTNHIASAEMLRAARLWFRSAGYFLFLFAVTATAQQPVFHTREEISQNTKLVPATISGGWVHWTAANSRLLYSTNGNSWYWNECSMNFAFTGKSNGASAPIPAGARFIKVLAP